VQKLRKQQQAQAAASDSEVDTEAMDAEANRKAAKDKVLPESCKQSCAEEKAEWEMHKNNANLGLYKVFCNMALISHSSVYPVFGIIFCKTPPALQVVSAETLAARGITVFLIADNSSFPPHEGNMNGLYFFIIAIGSMFPIGL
jgi:hypothetical protein